MMMSLKRASCLWGWSVLVSSAVLAGCGGTAGLKIRDAVLIESVPPGAQVRVSGRDIGVTPLTVELDKAFPRHWNTRIKSDEEGFAFYRRLETLDLTKDGCEPYTRQVVEADLARDIKILLTCDPNYQPAAVVAPAAVPAAGANGSMESRLRTLDELKSKGLVTEDEYRAQRQRLLNGL